jgi:hypothetical protein
VSDFLSLLSTVQEAGFLRGQSSESVLAQVERFWGLQLPQQADSELEAQLMLVALDREKAWYADIKVDGDIAESYRTALAGWSGIAKGRFRPDQVEIGKEITFRLDGYQHRFLPAPGHYLDMRLLGLINASLCGNWRFWVCDGLGMPNLVFFLTPPERRRLALELNWPFVDSLTEAEPGLLHGYLADFWEQGMEEPPWLIFQDASYCNGPGEGWERDGMHTFADGGELTIFAMNGSVLWAGTFQSRRQSLFQKLHPGSPDWHPEGLDKNLWQSYFRRSPPLRACYRPPQGP